MEISETPKASAAPWNQGRLVGPKPPLKRRHIWEIRMRLKLGGHRRDLALFDLAIDSKLRGCDLVRLRVEDVVLHGAVKTRATVQQLKTRRPVHFEITEQTRISIGLWLEVLDVTDGFLFPGRQIPERPLTTRQYARLLRRWIALIGMESFRLWHALAAEDQSVPYL